MCIRDRPIGSGGLVERAGQQRLEDQAHQAGRRAALQGKRCLLYTSDAADERSSVDLGGRRIIKKNTHTWVEHRGYDIIKNATQAAR